MIGEEHTTSVWVVFYERGASRKNFSHAGGKEYFFDRQPPDLPVSTSTRLAADSLLAVVDGQEQSGAEQLRQLACVHPVGLVAVS